NNDLQQTNEDNLTAFQEQQTALLSGQSKNMQAGDKATEKSDLFNANPLAKTNEQDSLDKQDKKKISKEEAALEASTQQMLARQAPLEAQLYDAGPDTDKLKPMPIQYIAAQQAPRILSSNVAFQMANILRDVIQRGTAIKARALGRSDVGGKTGTTNDAKD
ncbi:penicillin-binding protein 1A, partial [Salmonella enterica subsp. enterica]|nr:penicillin-binding protein 1A [Salmonella enterica subsp. enterica]